MTYEQGLCKVAGAPLEVWRLSAGKLLLNWDKRLSSHVCNAADAVGSCGRWDGKGLPESITACAHCRLHSQQGGCAGHVHVCLVCRLEDTKSHPLTKLRAEARGN